MAYARTSAGPAGRPGAGKFLIWYKKLSLAVYLSIIARIYLDNFDHIKAYWPMIGRTVAQLSLAFGVDDLDGTIDDSTRIYAMAGSEEQAPALSTEQLVNLIKCVGRQAIERDTIYNELMDYTDYDFKVNQDPDVFLQLPVVNSPSV